MQNLRKHKYFWFGVGLTWAFGMTAFTLISDAAILDTEFDLVKLLVDFALNLVLGMAFAYLLKLTTTQSDQVKQDS